MTDRSILFSAPMIEALLAGRKTQTRRAREPVKGPAQEGDRLISWPADALIREGVLIRPGFAVGDRLWVRETYYQMGHWEPVIGKLTKGGKHKWAFIPYNDTVLFKAPEKYAKARPRSRPDFIQHYKRLGRFMPRKHSRLTLLVTDVRVEKLQDISEADCIAEGPKVKGWADFGLGNTLNGVMVETDQPHVSATPRCWYRELWDSINGAGSWDANPWVVAVTFELQKGNIDHG
jgi:hypothetical protein